MLATLISIAGIVITLLFVVGTHEAAHFFTARALGVKVLAFSIGFGKTIFSFTDKRGTQFALAWIPLGGFVRMLDSREDKVSATDFPRAYDQQPYYKKSLIILAGPACNLFCAFVLYWLVFVTGFVAVKPIIGPVQAQSIAATAGLQPEQQIISIDGQETKTWAMVLFRLIAHMGNEDTVNVTTRGMQSAKTTEHALNLAHWNLDGLNPDLFGSLGFQPYEPPIPLVIEVVLPNSPAALAGLKVKDKLVSYNNVKIADWNQLLTLLNTTPETTVPMVVSRNGKKVTVNITPTVTKHWFKPTTKHLGIAPYFIYPAKLLDKVQYGPLAALPQAGTQLFDFIRFNLLFFKKLVTGKLSLQSLGGPITIFDSAGQALNVGWLPFASFLAFLSIAIGVINLLPIPGLDGGQWLMQTIETCIRRPLPEKVTELLYRAGFFIIIFVLIQAIINDVLRLFH